MLKRQKSLTAKLKICDPELKLYVIALEKENFKLHKKIANLQVQNVTYQNEITALKKAQPKLNIVIKKYGQENNKNKKIKPNLPIVKPPCANNQLNSDRE